VTADENRIEYEQYLSKMTKEAGFAFSGKVFGVFFGFVAQAIIANLLGADILGVFVLAWTVVQAVTLLATLGFENSFIRYISMYVSQDRPGEARSVFFLGTRLALLAAVAGALAVVVLRRPIAIGLFDEPRLESGLLWIALAIIPFTLARIFGGALRALKDVKRFVLGFDVSWRVARLVVFLVLYLLGLKLLGLVGGAIAASVVALIILWRFLRVGFPSLAGDEAVEGGSIPVRSITAYSIAMLADGAMAFAMQHSDRLVLGIFLDSAHVGVYNIAALIASLTTFVLFSFNAIFSSVIADVYHRDRGDLLRSLFRSVTRWVIILTLPVYAWILAAGEATLSVFGSEFIVGYVPLVILATGQLVAAGTGSVGICLAMTGHQKYNVYNTLTMAILSIVLNMILVPRMGIAGAGFATGAAYVFVNIARLVEVRLLLGITPYDGRTLKVIATGAITIGAALLFRRYAALPMNFLWSVVVLIACAVLVGLLTVMMGVRDEDRTVFRMAMNKIIRWRGGA